MIDIRKIVLNTAICVKQNVNKILVRILHLGYSKFMVCFTLNLAYSWTELGERIELFWIVLSNVFSFEECVHCFYCDVSFMLGFTWLCEIGVSCWGLKVIMSLKHIFRIN